MDTFLTQTGISQSMDFIQALHFIRPTWFYTIIPLLIMALLLLRSQKLSRSWQSIIDPALLPHLLVGQSVKQSSKSSLLFIIIGLLIITSLAGPSWEKRPQPVFKEKSSLVIALDLSRSMDAADIKPSRLTRARHKITDILKLRKLGQTALLVYAADAFTVSPLTDDTATITALLPSLTTDLMPAQGTRTDKAIAQAVMLLKNASIQHGDILLVTDGIEPGIEESIKAASKNHRISILAIATKEGAPIPQPSGGFVKNRQGAIVVPKLSINSLQKFSQLGKGDLVTISADDRDINMLSSLFNKNRFESRKGSLKTSLKTDSWYEQGPWLLLLAIPLLALTFRRGIVFIFIFLLIQPPQPVYADSLWDSLWTNADQRAARLLNQEKAEQAAKLFNNKQWKSSAYYKAKQYQKSIDELKNTNTADAHYNSGNAYAKLGQTDKAISEYDIALKIKPDHADAKFNKKLLMNKKKEQSKNNKKESQKSKSKKEKSHKNKSGQDKKDKSGSQSKSKKNKKNKKKSGSQGKSQKENNNKSNSNSNKQEEVSKNKKNEQPNKASSDKQLKDSKKEDMRSKQKKSDKKDNGKKSKTKAEQLKEKQTQQITEQWLRRIPDDPGGLLRNKFRYQYQRQPQNAPENKNW